MIRVLSDDTDVFVLLIYWVFRKQVQCKVQMERWDGTVLDINSTCSDLGSKCSQLLGMHALTGCDTTSYPYGKGKATALKALLAGQCMGLEDVLGEVNMTSQSLLDAARIYFTALYSQPQGTSLESARLRLYTKSKKNPKVMALPPTSANLLQHVLRAHLQIMLWKAADQQGPPEQSTDITQFGWEFKDDIPIPVIAHGDPAPSDLIDVIKCQCRAQGKMCSSEACGCHKERMSCTLYCYCSGKEGCFNPFTVTEESRAIQEHSSPDVNESEDVDLDEDAESDVDVQSDVTHSDYIDEWE